MIDAAYLRVMARYNRWQNENLSGTADTLDDATRRQDLGAFFGSIHATLSHVAWADSMWLSRLTDWPRPPGGVRDSVRFQEDWQELKSTRAALDAALMAWAEAATQEDVGGTLRWFSGVSGREVEAPRAKVILHLFNHQTHHRGQVHALLTRCGAKPGDTDLFLMPD